MTNIWVICLIHISSLGNFSGKTVELKGYVNADMGSEFIINFTRDAQQQGLPDPDSYRNFYAEKSSCRLE